jgi:hypothetical protein
VIVAVVFCPPRILTLITYVPGIRSVVKPGDAMRRDDLTGGGVDGKAGVGVYTDRTGESVYPAGLIKI